MQGALTPGLDPAVGRFEHDREVAGQQLGRAREQVAQPVPLLRDLLGRVEDERGVEASGIGPRRDRFGEGEHDREATFHVGGTEPVQDVAVASGGGVAVCRDGVEMATEHEPSLPAQLAADDDVVAHAVDRQPPAALAQACLGDVGQRAFVLALRRHRTHLLGEPEEIRHGATLTWWRPSPAGCR